MNTAENSSKEYICKICIKYYSSRQNLWRHNRTFHSSEILQNAPKTLECTPKLLPNTPKMLSNAEEMNALQCEYCKIIFTRKYNLKRHYDTCKQKIIEQNKINDQTEELKKQNELLQQKIKENEIKIREEMKEEIAAMKKQLLSIMNKQCKVHPKTLQKINNTLNNSCNTTNNIINIVQLGNENLENVFSKNKQIEILKQRYGCLPYLIREAHLNDKYPQFKNILITNLQNNIAYKYDKTTKNFIAVDKSELLNEVVGARMDDIESFFESNTDVLDEKTKNCVEQFISKMDSRDGTYYDDKMKDVKLMIYNNRDKVSKELIQTLEIIV
jgi:hypothetical protein